MSFKSWNSYWDFSWKVRYENRYIHNPDVNEFLSVVLKTSKDRIRTIKAGSIFCRSQLGNNWRSIVENGEEIADEPAPLPKERMKPVKKEAKEGRANPKGIPYLYLASNEKTAIAEARPWTGSNISVGQFKVVKNLIFVDCSVNHAESHKFYFKEPSEEEKVKTVWTHIDRAFSAPVTSSDKSSDYVPTQIIAELFKKEGYDGLIYKSALADGFNLVLFDVDSAKIVNCSVFEVGPIDFDYSPSGNTYFVRDD